VAPELDGELDGEPVMLAIVEGDLGTERLLHLALAPYQEVGEWFRYEGAVADLVERFEPGLEDPAVREKRRAMFPRLPIDPSDI